MKQVMGLGAALALSMIGAYVTWTAEPEAAPDGVVVYHADAEDLRSVRFTKGEDLIVELQRLSDGSGSYVQIEVTDRKEIKPEHPVINPEVAGPVEGDDTPEDDDAAEPESEEGEEGPEEGEDTPQTIIEPEYETSISRFTGGEKAEELWAKFAPLVAIRELPSASTLDTYGLEDPQANLTIVRASGEVALAIGDESYGTHHRYVQMSAGSAPRNFLLDSKLIRQIEGAKTTLVEKRLHPVGESDLTRLDIKVGSQTRSLVQTNRDDKTKAFWADAETADVEDVQAGTWLAKFLKIRVLAYPKPDTNPGPLTTLFEARVHGPDSSWDLTILANQDEKPQYYAKSAFNRSLVTLPANSVEDALADLDELLRGPAEAVPTNEAQALEDPPE